MKPSVLLATTTTPDGATLTLHRRDGHYHLRVGGLGLMSTTATGSEMQLAQAACERLGAVAGGRVLIGGLGLGFTLRRVLELAPADVEVQVAELMPEVVAWNREHLRDVNGGLLDDPRVEVLVADVVEVVTDAAPDSWDAVIIDVDNGPFALVDHGSGRLYGVPGLRAVARALRPGGRAVFWSAAPDPAFMRRLAAAGFRATAIAARAYPTAKRRSHTLFVADRQR
ncbi:MAG TPA: spermine synthase [Candidatus Dormibacteraeota bacterium]|nr:spermine synthase [Candidatus Dormibacteraeota bacterium]